MLSVLLVLVAGGSTIAVAIVGMRWWAADAWRVSLTAYRLGLPAGLVADDVAAWLGQIVASTHAPRFGLMTPAPVGLEVSATEAGIEHVLLVPGTLEGAVLAALRSALPGVRLEPLPDYLADRQGLAVAAEARLTSLRRPLAHGRAEGASRAMLAALQPLRPGERVVLQWLFTGAMTPAPASAASSAGAVLDLLGGEGLTSDSEALRAARLKQQEPLLQAVVRLGVAANPARTWMLFGWVWGTLRGLNAPGVRVVRRWLPSELVVDRLRRLAVPLLAWPLIVNTRELAGLLGLPLGTTPLPGLPHNSARQLPPPVALPTRGTVLAMSTYPGMTNRPLALKTADRLRHTWVIGPTGTGKSTFIAGLVRQDMVAGGGTVVIDPKGGDLIADVLNGVPENRRDDVIVLDPSATDNPVGLNVLDIARGEHARELAVDHLVHLMASLWRSSWGPRTSDVLRAALLTLVYTRAADGSRFTLIELPELLVNPAFRQFVTGQSTVPETVREFWMSYESMSDGERAQVIGPSLNKLRAFTTRTALRLMLGQSDGIRLDDVFTKRRILLVALPKGVLGAETTALVGALVVAGLWQATLARSVVVAEKRHPVMFYLDEFQDFLRLPLDLADMLAQARGLGVGLLLAHQYLGQLTDEVKTAVLGTVRTQVAFQVEYDDARTLAPRFAPMTQADLSNLGAYEIALRPAVAGATLPPVTGRTLPLGPALADGAAVSAASHARYGVARAEVEAAWRSRLNGQPRRVGRTEVGDDR
ncbi:type IV secretory system conjugative DNA transfer family protein [Amycolatopsis sp. cmx-4-68]|uniref:type IV secretory system conjugative DNA transfer family protein n=1 Tax=Amycolatopsis sp. cmx-4-68 TaxID=2790938 RepID=UPI0039787665